MNIRRTFSAAAVALAATGFAPTAQAYDELVVFGDSLSDNGNLFRASLGFAPAKPYYQGRFSNGPVAVEVMAETLGIPLVNFAFGGASSGLWNQYVPDSATGVRGQVNGFLSKLADVGQAADAADLYVVWAGGNDLLSEIDLGRRDNMQPLIDTVVDNLVGSVAALYDAGARNMLMPLLPDMASSYHGTSGRLPADLLSETSMSFNATLRTRMGSLQVASPGLTLRIFDTPSVLAGFRADMVAAGANVTDRCWTGEFWGKGNLCPNPDAHYLFDRVHPTAAVHSFVGRAMASAVPEPASMALLGVGVLTVLLAASGRLRRASSQGG